MTLEGVRDVNHRPVELDPELPIIFIDIDGVINSIPFEERWIGPERRTLSTINDRNNWEYVRVESDNPEDYEIEREFLVTLNRDHYHHESRFGDPTKAPRGRELREAQAMIRVSEEMLEGLRTLVRERKAQIVYLTWWRSEALRVIEPEINLGAVGYLDWNSESDLGHRAKLHALANLYEGFDMRNPFVVIDDEALKGIRDGYTNLWYVSPSAPNEAQERALELNAIEHLYVEPDTRWGINRMHMASIHGFIDSLA